VAAQVDAVVPKGRKTVAWIAIMGLIETTSTFLKLFSVAVVLMDVLREQTDGITISLLSFASDVLSLFTLSDGLELGGGKRCS
jgi:hypothetical protein